MDISQLISDIIKFRNERNWKQFHTIKDLCMGLNIEVGELQELFLWKSDSELEILKREKKEDVANEIADIFIFLVYICDEFDIQLLPSIASKLNQNGIKYPLDKSYGSNKKYTEL